MSEEKMDGAISTHFPCTPPSPGLMPKPSVLSLFPPSSKSPTSPVPSTFRSPSSDLLKLGTRDNSNSECLHRGVSPLDTAASSTHIPAANTGSHTTKDVTSPCANEDRSIPRHALNSFNFLLFKDQNDKGNQELYQVDESSSHSAATLKLQHDVSTTRYHAPSVQGFTPSSPSYGLSKITTRPKNIPEQSDLLQGLSPPSVSSLSFFLQPRRTCNSTDKLGLKSALDNKSIIAVKCDKETTSPFGKVVNSSINPHDIPLSLKSHDNKNSPSSSIHPSIQEFSSFSPEGNHDHETLQLHPETSSREHSTKCPQKGLGFISLIDSQANAETVPTYTASSSAESTPSLKDSSPSQDKPSSTSPFTPRSRGMMRKLNIHSPSKSLESTTSKNFANNQFIHSHLPPVPTFSFTPPIVNQKNCIISNDSKGTIVDSCSPLHDKSKGNSASSTPLTATVTSASSAHSSFHYTLRGPKTPIGNRQGSSFKIFPSRLNSYLNLSTNNTGAISVAHSSASKQSDTSVFSSSPYSTSPSPRVVPLTVLSKNGSPVVSSPRMGVATNTNIPLLSGISANSTPYDPSSSQQPGVMASPLMRSLDKIAKKDKELEDAENRGIEKARDDFNFFPPQLGVRASSASRLQASPLSSDNHPVLPKIKLTPRSRKVKDGNENCATLLLDSSIPSGSPSRLQYPPSLSQLSSVPSLVSTSGSSSVVSRLAPRGFSINTKAIGKKSKSKETCPTFTDTGEDPEAVEMDYLLSGFEHHRATIKKKQCPEKKHLDSHVTKRVDDNEAEEEVEMAELASERMYRREETDDDQAFSSRPSDGDISFLSPGDKKPIPRAPMLSIAPPANGQGYLKYGQLIEPNNPPRTLDSFLSTRSMSRPKSRSLFCSSLSQDPIENLLRADAIVEASRSDEPLTDDDSDTKDDADFLLCLPQANRESRGHFSTSKPSRIVEDNPSFSFQGLGHVVNPTSLCSREFDILSESPSVVQTKLDRHESNCFIRYDNRNEQNDQTSTVAAAYSSIESRFSTPELVMGKASFRSGLNGSRDAEGYKKRETSDATFSTFCSLSDCDSSDIMASPKYPRKKTQVTGPKGTGLDYEDQHFCRTENRASTCSLLSSNSLCGLDIVHEARSGNEVDDLVSCLMPSESSELLRHSDESTTNAYNRPMRSELSVGSLALSIDSNADTSTDQRDLFTPPLLTSLRSGRQMLSPPPIRPRPPHSTERG